jgi:hypothetical protein
MVYLRGEGDRDDQVDKWVRAGLPVAVINVGAGVAGLASEFFRWEMATAVACHLLAVNAFDQPDVEQAKQAARQALRGQTAAPAASAAAAAPEHVVEQALQSLRPGDAFVALAFLPETPAVARSLGSLRRRVRDYWKNATLVGFGPRYLHSTGQLFKGGPDRLVTLILWAPSSEDLDVPHAGHTLGDLLRAQALGDLEAMKALGRRVFLCALDSPRQLADLAEAVARAAGRQTAR